MSAMTVRRRWILLSLLAFVVFLIIMFGTHQPSTEPTYQGKPVSLWFREYAFRSNLPIASSIKGITRDGKSVLLQVGNNGSVTLRTMSNLNSIVRIEFQEAQPDPSWTALKTLGTNAVPHLVHHLGVGLLDSTYKRVFTNLPGSFQSSLPDPIQKQTLRLRAIEALGNLGVHADGATTELIRLLRRNDPSLHAAVIVAINRIHPSRKEITKVLLELGSERRYIEAVQIAKQMGWEGDEMARLLASMLRSPSISMRRDAVTLLEQSKAGARPALPELIEALNDSDDEVRYLAARAFQYIEVLSSQAVEALRLSLKDPNVMVINAARRALESNGLP